MNKETKIKQWVQCPQCSNKLFGVRHAKDMNIQIKCRSCRALVTISANGDTITINKDKSGFRFPPDLDYK